ncbi:hypothetical protein D5S19_27720 [Amycolatopsis panacis]|uniref:PE domain-containing protein n=1 Tax=Amycolatopsis panacis TaxID=2340917 RepID=A0A419HPW6_9PSEU|nr:hypothetical protein D5S19_27720 [Amycolatopsis panacis]
MQVDGYGPGGGYVFNAEEAGGVIKQWEDLLVGLREDLENARAVAYVTAPADEVASHVFIDNGARPSGQSLLAEHQAMVDYTTNFITALKAAKNKITVAEQEAADSVKKSGDV